MVCFIVATAVGLFAFGPAPFRQARLGIVRSVQAQEKEGCTLATLQGTYLLTVRLDTRSDLPDPMLPGVVAGVRIFDGAGNLSQVASDSMGGVITQRIAATGTYTLDSQCIGTMTIRGRPWDIFVAEDGSEGVGTRTDPGTIAAQTFKKRSGNGSR
jgi:hypothetical protein